MAFGKKKKQKQMEKELARERREAAAANKVVIGENILYPAREESAAREVMTALATAVVALILVWLIIQKKSYAFNSYDGYSTSGVSDQQTVTTESTEVVTESGEDIVVVEKAGRVGDAADTSKDADGSNEEDTAMSEGMESVTGYILPASNSAYLSSADLEGLSAQELCYAKNEIYARHGRRFLSAELQTYFDSKDWYEGTYEPSDFDANYSNSVLNDYEKRNAELIRDAEYAVSPGGYPLDR